MSNLGDATTRLPDTTIVEEALSILKRAATPAVVNHSIRSYLLGATYARHRGLDFDEEGLATAAAFHDLGLCTDYRDPRAPFQFVGSRELRRFLCARGVEPARIEPLAEAIDYHMQMLPRWSKGNVVGLLQVGAWMDITGLRRWNVRKEAKEIEAVYPRAGIGMEFNKLLLRSIGSVRSCIGLMLPDTISRS